MTQRATAQIGICGLGTVGQGVWKHLERSRAELEARLGLRIVVRRAAVKNLRKARAVKIPAAVLTADAMAVATDPDIDIVCELIGGTGLAKRVTLAALRRGKIVISANKALIRNSSPSAASTTASINSNTKSRSCISPTLSTTIRSRQPRRCPLRNPPPTNSCVTLRLCRGGVHSARPPRLASAFDFNGEFWVPHPPDFQEDAGLDSAPPKPPPFSSLVELR